MRTSILLFIIIVVLALAFYREESSQEVVVHELALSDVQNLCEGLVGFRTSGCAEWNLSRTKCEIYIPRVADVGTAKYREIYEHELAHCQIGNYH